MQTVIVPQTSIDLTGKTISTFIVYKVAARLRELAEGEVLEVITDDFAAVENDISAWCRMSGNVVERVERGTDHQSYSIRKAAPRQLNRSLAMVLSNTGLEELLSPLGFALAAALSEVEVHIYFQGPAVRTLTKDFQEHLHGLSRPFSRFARRGLIEAGHLPARDKLSQLHELGAHFYLCGGSMGHFGVTVADLAFTDVTIAEYFTFIEVMTRADIHLFLQ